MPGTGRPGDPLWMAIGFAIGVIPGIWLHQVYAGLGIGMALAIAFGRIREDKRRLYRRPTDPTRFVIGLGIGLLGGDWLHSLGLRLVARDGAGTGIRTLSWRSSWSLARSQPLTEDCHPSRCEGPLQPAGSASLPALAEALRPAKGAGQDDKHQIR